MPKAGNLLPNLTECRPLAAAQSEFRISVLTVFKKIFSRRDEVAAAFGIGLDFDVFGDMADMQSRGSRVFD